MSVYVLIKEKPVSREFRIKEEFKKSYYLKPEEF